MKIDPNAPMGISLPPVRASGFGIDSFSSPYEATALPAAPPAQGDRGTSPDARQRGLFGRKKGRQGKANSVVSWGNRGYLAQSAFEPRPEPKSVPADAMSDISEYSTPDYVPAPPPPAAITMSRGGSGLGRQRMQVEGYYPQTDSRGSGAWSSSSKGIDSRNLSAAGDRPRANEYSPMGPSYVPPPLMSTGIAPNQNYYPSPPSRANPLVQRRLSEYEVDDNYDEDGAGRTSTGGAMFRPAPAGQFGIAL